MKYHSITTLLLSWYQKNKRDLPWREDRNPYRIWLSEIILQQTRVDQGLPYFLKFIGKFPTIFDLAKAREDEILRTWQGLGYYSRARNLHKCAKIVVEKYDGVFPSSVKELQQLPGIGPYTSAAIASLAFGKQEAVMDGNVIRVISRLYGIEQDVALPKTTREIKSIADKLISSDNPELFNQAIMEFGAIFCTPNNPSCDSCGFNDICVAHLNRKVKSIPFKSKKIKKRIRYFNYLFMEMEGKVMVRKRTGKDIWHGLFEFYLIENDSPTDFDNLRVPKIMTEQADKWEIVDESPIFKHLLTHQTIICRFYHVKMDHNFIFNPADWPEYHLYSIKEFENLPKSILIDRYLGEKIN